jgi:hypothetical protein
VRGLAPDVRLPERRAKSIFLGLEK